MEIVCRFFYYSVAKMCTFCYIFTLFNNLFSSVQKTRKIFYKCTKVIPRLIWQAPLAHRYQKRQDQTCPFLHYLIICIENSLVTILSAVNLGVLLGECTHKLNQLFNRLIIHRIVY